MEARTAPYLGSDPYIFVSYSHDDEEEVLREVRWLGEQGFNLWWDEGIGAGSHWRDEIADRIKQCSLFLSYVSPNSAASVVCREELEYALTHSRTILSVHLAETVLPEGISLAISNRQALFRFSLNTTDYERRLLAAIAPRLGAEVSAPKGRSSRRLRVPTRGIVQVLGGIAAALVGVIATLWFVGEDVSRQPSGRFAINMPATFAGAGTTYLAINGAGTHLFVLASLGYPHKQIYMRALSEFESVPVLQDTDLSRDVIGFFPDYKGENLGLALTDGELKRVSTVGGTPVSVASTANNAFFFHARWIDDQTILLNDRKKIVELSIDGSAEPRTLVEENAGLAYMLPDRSAFVYSRNQQPRGSADKIVIQSLTSARSKVLLDGFDPRVTKAGHLLFFADDAVWAAHISRDGFELLSEPVKVLDKVRSGGGKAQYEVADTGTMVFATKFEPEMVLAWVSRQGLTARVPLEPGLMMSISLSPDESQVAYAGGPGLWTYSFDNGTSTRVAASKIGRTLGALWLPGGEQIAYTVFTFFSGAQLNVVNVNSGEVKQLATTDKAIRATSVAADGSLLVIEDCETYDVNCDIGLLPLVSPEDRELILDSEFNEYDGQLSPDGQFLAYSTDEFGPRRIVVRPFPDVAKKYWQVPVDDCGRSEWSEAGDELFLACTSGRYVVAVSRRPEFALDKPQLLYTQPGRYFLGMYSGRRKQFLTIEQTTKDDTFIVVTNWFDELDRLIAAGQQP